MVENNNLAYTPGKLVSAATTNATVLLARSGVLGYIQASNVNAAVRYLKIYDKATAPTVGTDVPKHTVLLPIGGVGVLHIPMQGIEFINGISIALTTEATDAGSTGVSISEHVVNYGIK